MSLGTEEENRLFSLPVRRHRCTPPRDLFHSFLICIFYLCYSIVLFSFCYIPLGYLIDYPCVVIGSVAFSAFYCYLPTGLRNIYETKIFSE